MGWFWWFDFDQKSENNKDLILDLPEAPNGRWQQELQAADSGDYR